MIMFSLSPDTRTILLQPCGRVCGSLGACTWKMNVCPRAIALSQDFFDIKTKDVKFKDVKFMYKFQFQGILNIKFKDVIKFKHTKCLRTQGFGSSSVANS